MKNSILALSILLLASSLQMQAQERTIERTYVSTDKDSYVAGDNIWCSAFCMNATTGKLSQLSSTLYVELVSAQGVAETMKIALVDGRGAGTMALSSTLPTGNYRMVAYTRQNTAEEDYDFGAFSKVISVYNTYTKERVKDGVEVVTSDEYAALLSAAEQPAAGNGAIGIEVPKHASTSSQAVIKLSSSISDAASLSISVRRHEELVGSNGLKMPEFISAIGKSGNVRFSGNAVPDYEGEVIRAHVEGNVDPVMLAGKFAFISVPGGDADVYSSDIDEKGNMTFYTSNIYGDRDLVCEVAELGDGQNCRIRLEQPFVELPAMQVPKLPVCESVSRTLTDKGVSMQIEKHFMSDTLFEMLPVRGNMLLGGPCASYILDDYTRFPLMEEDIVEFISHMRARKTSDGRRDLQIRLEDQMHEMRFVRDHSLMMVDGVPVFDHEKIYRYDPLLVQRIDIYTDVYYIGKKQYGGIANFVTYKHDMPGMTFGENVRIVDFKGVSWPLAYTCRGEVLSGDYPDYRNTIYWHPSVVVPAGGSIEIPVVTPFYGATFDVVVEGVSSNGVPIYETSSFVVE